MYKVSDTKRDCAKSWQYSKKKVSEYDQEIPQPQTADNPWHREEEPHNNDKTPERQSKQRNQLSLPYRDDCKTIMDTK